MAAKLKKGDKVVVLAGKDKGKRAKSPLSTRKPAKLLWTASTSPSVTPSNPRRPRRPHPKGDADPTVQPGAAGQQRQSNPRWLPHGRRQESAFRQDNRGCDLMLDTANYTPRLKAQYQTRFALR